jgi:hypothetical protein
MCAQQERIAKNAELLLLTNPETEFLLLGTRTADHRVQRQPSITRTNIIEVRIRRIGEILGPSGQLRTWS